MDRTAKTVGTVCAGYGQGRTLPESVPNYPGAILISVNAGYTHNTMTLRGLGVRAYVVAIGAVNGGKLLMSRWRKEENNMIGIAAVLILFWVLVQASCAMNCRSY